MTALSFVNRSGRQVGRVNMRALQRATGSRDVEVTRTDLAAILYQASRDLAEYMFGDTVTALSQDGGGVDDTFEKAAPRRFDLVIGAEGLHSATRGLAFGPESEFVHHAGIYVATMPLNALAEHKRVVVMYNAPGRMAAIYPVRGRGRRLATAGVAGPGARRRRPVAGLGQPGADGPLGGSPSRHWLEWAVAKPAPHPACATDPAGLGHAAAHLGEFEGHGCSAWRPGIPVCADGTAGVIIPTWAISFPIGATSVRKTSRDGRI